MRIKVFIIDEAHYLKNYNTKRVKYLMPIIMKAKRTILLSGTPIISRPVEFFNLLKILRPDITPMFQDFTERYCDPKDN